MPSWRTLAPLAFGLCGLVFARPAAAQVYLQTEVTDPYVPLANLPGITGITPVSFSGVDEGQALVPIPFTYSYLGQGYTEVTVGVNGVAHFGAGAFPGYFNEAVGSVDSNNNTIFIWWDDLIMDQVDGNADYGVLGAAPDRILVIEVRNWEHYDFDGLSEGAWQLWLYEGPTGRFEVHYGGAASASELYSATAGWEGATGVGVPFGDFRPCSQTADCDETIYAGMVGRTFAVELAEGPELTGDFGLVPRGALPGTAVNVELELRNVGTEAAPTFTSNLYLSSTGVIDGTARLVGTFTTGPLAAGAQTTVTATVTVPAGTAPAEWSLLAELDATDLVTEAEESNNLLTAPGSFATAFELRPIVVTPLGGGNVGQTITIDLELGNEGVPFIGNVSIQLYASRDRNLDGNDVTLGTVNAAVGAAVLQTLSLPVTLPVLTPGRFYVIARVDSTGTLVELFESNNLLASVTTFDSGPNLVPEAAVVPAGAEPGQQITFDLTIGNRGVPLTGNLAIRVLASPDPIFDLNDPLLGNTTVTLTGAATQVVSLNFTVPALAPGGYHPIFRLDPGNQIPEIDETDNNLSAPGRFLTGPDLAITGLSYDTEGTPGQPFPITTEVASLGAPFNGTVGYRLYVSTDQVLDPNDPVLATYSISFTGQASLDDPRSPLFPAVAAGRYYVLARIDPLGTVAETNEGNNVYIGQTRLDSGPDFSVYNAVVLPDVVDPLTPFVISANVENLGSPFTGAVPYQVILSDFSLQPGDPVVFDGVLFFNGEDEVAVTATVTLGLVTPPVRPGDYYAYLVVDPANQISERSENNNDDDDDVELLGANLFVRQLDGPPVAFLGRNFTVTVTLENSGPYPATDFVYGVYFSDNGIVAQGRLLFTSPPLSLPAGARVTLTENLTVPLDLPPGDYALGAVVDPTDVVPELNEADNPFLSTNGVRVLPLMPDLVARIVQTATAAAAGSDLMVTRILENLGPAPGNASYRYYLSSDSLIRPSDRPLTAFVTSLPANDYELAIDRVQLPSDLVPGTYYLGLYLDPDELLEESDETNNGAAGPAIPIYAADLRIVTTTLEPGTRGAPYEVGLYAVGGSQGFSWSVPVGVLPPGLTLTASTGIISGVPQSEGQYGFTVRVSSGGAIAEQPLILNIGSVTVALAWPAQAAPLGFVGRPYETRLVAVGGVPPYNFVSQGGLPSGLVLEVDGRLHGLQASSVTSVLQVRLRDQAGAVVTGEVPLRFVDPQQRVLITPAPLPVGVVGRDYCLDQPIQLFASGGVAPYRWSLRMGSVPGLNLSGDGQLCGTPETAGRFELVVGVYDQDNQEDTSGLVVDILGADDLAIRETSLPDALLGQPYTAAVTAQGGTTPYAFSVAVGTLPPGLNLAPDGQISGTPTVVGDSAFLVVLSDARTGTRSQPLSIRVVDPSTLETSEAGCGCSTAGGPAPAPSLGIWVLFSALWLRRRVALATRG
ncbi:MAG: putative Ig domain-containing protein [Deltaproteobacteria bacterium]|nr:putative Ig domain-containing protein [Deltaproteobacteria bacterium]